MIKIKANKLLGFLKKSTANGSIEDCKLVFGEDGLTLNHKNLHGTVFISGFFDKVNFDEYEKETIEIKRTETLLKVLSSFGDNLINIVKNDLAVKIMDDKSSVILALPEEIECYQDARDKLEELDFKDPISVDSNLFDILFKRNSIIVSDEIRLITTNKEFKASIGRGSDFSEVYTDIASDKEINVLFNYDLFSSILSNTKGILTMFLKQNEPTKIIEAEENYNIEYYIMPMDEE